MMMRLSEPARQEYEDVFNKLNLTSCQTQFNRILFLRRVEKMLPTLGRSPKKDFKRAGSIEKNVNIVKAPGLEPELDNLSRPAHTE